MCEALNYYEPRMRYEFFLDGLRNKQMSAVLNASMVTSIPEACALLLYKNLHLSVEEENEFANDETALSSANSASSTQSQMLQQPQQMNQMMLKPQQNPGTLQGHVNVVAPSTPQVQGAPTANGNADAHLGPLRIHLGPDTRTTEGGIVCGRWPTFFAEYDFRVEYKPRRLNVVADAFSRRPDYAVQTADANRIGVQLVSAPSSSLIDDAKAGYVSDADAKQLLSYASAPSDEARRKLAPRLRARAHRYRVHLGLLLYSAVDDDVIRIVVPNDYDLRMRIMYEYHDAPTTGHPCREKTYVLLTRDFYWNHQYKWVRKLRSNHFRHRRSVGGPSLWTLSLVFRLTVSGGLVSWSFVDRFCKMVHLDAVPAEVTAVQTARRFVDMVFKHHGMPLDIVSDRDPRFTARFWQEVFTLLGTQLSMSTADHPQTDGQTERVNHVLGNLLKSYAHSLQQCIECLPMAEFAINNSVHASTGHTPFYVNAMRHPRLPSMLGMVASSLSGGGSTVASEQPQKSGDTDTVSAITTQRQAASRSGNETMDKNYGSVQGTDTASKENTSVQGTDSAQAGPAARTSVALS
ncbi:hypothetical protein PC123_g24850 [Phytophthora cactorum]|nr:hypothetical protein PC123_g24850 [Phytophthora cactorum]